MGMSTGRMRRVLWTWWCKMPCSLGSIPGKRVAKPRAEPGGFHGAAAKSRRDRYSWVYLPPPVLPLL